MASNQYRILPIQGAIDQRQVSEVVNNAMQGKTNNFGDVVLVSSGIETTLTDERLGFNSVVLLTPRSSNAASEINYIFIKTKNKGSCVIGHRNHGLADVLLDYVIVG